MAWLFRINILVLWILKTQWRAIWEDLLRNENFMYYFSVSFKELKSAIFWTVIVIVTKVIRSITSFMSLSNFEALVLFNLAHIFLLNFFASIFIRGWTLFVLKCTINRLGGFCKRKRQPDWVCYKLDNHIGDINLEVLVRYILTVKCIC